MELAPLKPIANKRYTVQISERHFVRGIEAPNAHIAMELAESNFPKCKGKSLSAHAQNIYESGISLSDDCNGAIESGDGIFEIKIRGCDPRRVQELKIAIVKYLGAPFLEGDDIGKSDPFLKSFRGLCVEGY
jgi:hypothetical protein